jgi:two-component system, NtrC family, sensor kinase
MRRGAKPGKAKVKARLPVARKAAKKEASGRRELEKRLAEALEQQTATAEILRVINRTQTDVQPVFDVIVENACRLCDGVFANAVRFDGELMHNMAYHGFTREAAEALIHAFPRRAARDSMSGRAILAGGVVHSEDTSTDDDATVSQQLSGLMGFRAQVSVPLLRDGVPVGAITVARRERGRFPERQVALLKTFADQAVIAIENVRLFNELEGRNRDLTEGLERETATGEILRVISSSPTDIQPVLDTVVKSAARLCDAYDAQIFQREGDQLLFVAHHGPMPSGPVGEYTVPLVRGTINGRSVLEGLPVHVADMQAERDEFPEGSEIARRYGHRTVLSLPLMREGVAMGTISVRRAEIRPFTERQIALLKTFADQAVIAIENVRLFKELEARTGDLTKSVEKLTALGEVSRAVSSTLDVEMVLDTIVSRATQLAGADGCAISEYDDATAMFHVRAAHGIDAALVGTLRTMPLRKGEGVTGRAAETREPIQVADITVPGAYQSHLRDVLIGAGFRAVLSVPLLREEQIIGSLSLNRKAPGEFPPEVVEVLKTFATQSALAIQNARLFREIADKSAQLEAASRHKSEFLANMSHELRTPLNAIIGFSEVLVDRMFGDLNEKQDEYLKDIYASGQHLLSLINDILDLSKIEAGRMELELADFDLPSAIDNALILVRERASRRGIALGHSVDERLGQIRGDERKVKQVLLNLLSNALKFTPEGGRIDVSARLQDGAAEIAVADTGVGIAPEDQEAVFEEFRQVGTADKKVEGTGLGLALSRKFIELHGGRIWVTSQAGQGSIFTFTLPVRRQE